MKSSGEKGNQAALCLQHEAFGLPDGKDGLTTIAREAIDHPARKNNIIGISEDLRLNVLKAENQRLKALVEDLSLDKTCQAQRIAELNRETSQLKKAIADLIIGNRT